MLPCASGKTGCFQKQLNQLRYIGSTFILSEETMKNPVSLVIATTNKGKTEEIKNLLADFPITVKSLEDFPPMPAVIEDGQTFEINACKKAVFISNILRLPALADDSGLVVESLGGSPGIHSARYAGENATDEQRYTKLLDDMQGETHRKAAFRCVIAIAVPNGKCLTYSADCEGSITRYPSGANGFGYDPVFYYPPLNKTFAELSREEKNSVSHRGKALQKVKEDFRNVLAWISRDTSSSSTETRQNEPHA